MEFQFNIGDKAEAVDEVGIWAPCHVVERLAEGYTVAFDGWSKKWDRYVANDEIRQLTILEVRIFVCGCKLQ